MSQVSKNALKNAASAARISWYSPGRACAPGVRLTSASRFGSGRCGSAAEHTTVAEQMAVTRTASKVERRESPENPGRRSLLRREDSIDRVPGIVAAEAGKHQRELASAVAE